MKNTTTSAHDIDRTLIKLRFTSSQKKQLKNTQHNIVELHHLLSEFGPHLLGKKCDLTTTQIVHIATQENGLKNLLAYAQYYEKLQQQGLGFPKIIKIIDRVEPYIIFPILDMHLSKLLKQRIPLNEIIYLSTVINQRSQIDQVLPYIKLFMKNKTSRKHVSYLLQNDLLAETKTFFELGFKPSDLEHLLQNEDPDRQLKMIVQQYSELRRIGLKHRDIFELLLEKNFMQHVEFILSSFENILRLGFSAPKLLLILKKENGSDNLAMLEKQAPLLLSFGYTRNELLKFIDNPSGAFYLQALYSRHLELRAFKLTPIQIMQTVLEELQDQTSMIYQDPMAEYQREIDEMRENDYLKSISTSLFSIFSSKKTFFEIGLENYQENTGNYPLENHNSNILLKDFTKK